MDHFRDYKAVTIEVCSATSEHRSHYWGVWLWRFKIWWIKLTGLSLLTASADLTYNEHANFVGFWWGLCAGTGVESVVYIAIIMQIGWNKMCRKVGGCAATYYKFAQLISDAGVKINTTCVSIGAEINFDDVSFSGCEADGNQVHQRRVKTTWNWSKRFDLQK